MLLRHQIAPMPRHVSASPYPPITRLLPAAPARPRIPRCCVNGSENHNQSLVIIPRHSLKLMPRNHPTAQVTLGVSMGRGGGRGFHPAFRPHSQNLSPFPVTEEFSSLSLFSADSPFFARVPVIVTERFCPPSPSPSAQENSPPSDPFLELLSTDVPNNDPMDLSRERK
ncbi:hypothetical protein PIB30_014873 [Stylosanthes scabra]|uniref:Uncharacterized protein n=1 Tax=Stylosanthes scabra TaxID=79078 RepID=A0ABU6T731_9FABA|nr:hypothetical protein [Stylosanthes scabra]